MKQAARVAATEIGKLEEANKVTTKEVEIFKTENTLMRNALFDALV
jgi:hypothetical protein